MGATSLDLSVTRSSSHFPSRLTLTAEYSISSGSAFGASSLGCALLDGHVGRDELNRRDVHFQLQLRLIFEQRRELLADGCPPDDLFAGGAVEIHGVGRPVIGQGLGVVLVECFHVGGGRLANGCLIGRLVAWLLGQRAGRCDQKQRGGEHESKKADLHHW